MKGTQLQLLCHYLTTELQSDMLEANLDYMLTLTCLYLL